MAFVEPPAERTEDPHSRTYTWSGVRVSSALSAFRQMPGPPLPLDPWLNMLFLPS